MAGAFGNKVMARRMLDPARSVRAVDRRRCLDEGDAAQAAGVASDACPYPARATERRRLWLCGWLTAWQRRVQNAPDPSLVLALCDH